MKLTGDITFMKICGAFILIVGSVFGLVFEDAATLITCFSIGTSLLLGRQFIKTKTPQSDEKN